MRDPAYHERTLLGFRLRWRYWNTPPAPELNTELVLSKQGVYLIAVTTRAGLRSTLREAHIELLQQGRTSTD